MEMIGFTKDSSKWDGLTKTVVDTLKKAGLEPVKEGFIDPNPNSFTPSGHPADDSRTKAMAKWNWHNSKSHEAQRQADEYIRLSHDHMGAKEEAEAKNHHDISCHYAAICHAHKCIADHLDKKHKFSVPLVKTN
jgi:hypothetical protein